MHSRVAWLLAGIALLAFAGLAFAVTTQTVDDKRGDSSGPVDIKRAKVTQDGPRELTFTIWAYESFRSRKSPCVFVYTGRHNDPGDDGYSIGCFGNFVSAPGEANGELERTRPSPKSVKYTLDPAALHDPAVDEKPTRFRWQALAGAKAGVWDKAPRRPKDFDGSDEATDPGNPQGPCYPLC